MTSPLVSSEWLNDHMNDQNLIVLDASPQSNVSGKASIFENQIIPKAQYFDIKNAFSDPSGIFPNTFPSAEQFEQACQSIGISNTSTIVVYDNLGIYTSPRVWWMFKTMGFENVSVLNGGLPDWIKQGYGTVDHHLISMEKGNFTSNLKSHNLVNIDFIRSNISHQNNLVIDARSEGRFNGTTEEPRKGIPSGSIENSINIPFEEVLNDGKFKSESELIELFQKVNVDQRPLTFSCGSAITACIVLFAANLVLSNETSLYDGSWTEWASSKKI